MKISDFIEDREDQMCFSISKLKLSFHGQCVLYPDGAISQKRQLADTMLQQIHGKNICAMREVLDYLRANCWDEDIVDAAQGVLKSMTTVEEE